MGAPLFVTEDELREKYSGELFARLMEITKDDAQKLVRNEGLKSERCGFWAVRKLMERYNARTYMRLLKMLLAVMKSMLVAAYPVPAGSAATLALEARPSALQA